MQNAAGLRWTAPGDPGTPSLTHYRVEANNGGGWVAAPSDNFTEGLSAGFNHTCALLDDGSVKCWGYGGLGRLGVGLTSNRGDGPRATRWATTSPPSTSAPAAPR